MQVNSNNSINFKSHLTPKLEKKIANADVGFIETAFAENYNVNAFFQNNKAMASCFSFTLNIFEEISEKFNLQLNCVPPFIKIFNKSELLDENIGRNFCIPDSGLVLRNEPPFPLRSIFMLNIDNIQQIDNLTDFQFINNKRSSSHFLSEFIHEWAHNLHLDLIYNKNGYWGECPFAKSIYPQKNKTQRIYDDLFTTQITSTEQNQIYNYLGEYASKSNSKMEIFAETLAKIITNSLDENLTVKKNPIDFLSNMPLNLKIFMEEQLSR